MCSGSALSCRTWRFERLSRHQAEALGNRGAPTGRRANAKKHTRDTQFRASLYSRRPDGIYGDACKQRKRSRALSSSRGYGIARPLKYASSALFYLGRRAEAKQLAEEALPLARALEGRKRHHLAYLLRVMAYLTDDVTSSRRFIAEAIQIERALGELLNVAYALADLGKCEFAAGNAQPALQRATEALDTTRPFSYAPSRIVALNDMSAYLISLARYDEAKQRAREALELARERSLDIHVAYAPDHLAAIVALRTQNATEGATHERAAQFRVSPTLGLKLLPLGARTRCNRSTTRSLRRCTTSLAPKTSGAS